MRRTAPGWCAQVGGGGGGGGGQDGAGEGGRGGCSMCKWKGRQGGVQWRGWRRHSRATRTAPPPPPPSQQQQQQQLCMPGPAGGCACCLPGRATRPLPVPMPALRVPPARPPPQGLAALLVQGLSACTPEEIVRIQPTFIELLGLQQSLTPSRNNGFLNMFKLMQKKAVDIYLQEEQAKKVREWGGGIRVWVCVC